MRRSSVVRALGAIALALGVVTATDARAQPTANGTAGAASGTAGANAGGAGAITTHPAAATAPAGSIPSERGATDATEKTAAEKEAAEKANKRPLLEIHGYIQPQFGVRHRPDALPRDQWEYVGLGTRAGIILSGSPAEMWAYTLHLSVDARTLVLLAGVDAGITQSSDGSSRLSIVQRKRSLTSLFFEEVTIAFTPIEYVTMKVGAMRMPFTVALSSANTALLFPNRPGANEAFQSGADEGALVTGQVLEGRLTGSLGVFTGTSLNLIPVGTEARGPLFSARVDASPLGKLPRADIDFERKGFRFGVGTGALYRTATLYSVSDGYELAQSRDVRISASLRAAFMGGTLQAEVLRRIGTDNLSSRPNQASGGYVQGSYFVPINDRIGLAPIARGGLTVEDEITLPRRTIFLEGGVSFFPRLDLPRPESLRFLIQYQGERRTTDQENAHAVVTQLQVLF